MSEKMQEDLYARQRAMSLIEFVNSLFDDCRDDKKQGLYIQREDGQWIRINIMPVDTKVIINMDDVNMGYFEEYEGQGYKAVFYQKHRVGIRNGLTKNEALMKTFCYHPLVRFFDA